MATTTAADRLLRCVHDGCIARCDSDIERRPYHRNCGCALHKSRNKSCAHGFTKFKSVSYPLRKSRSEGCLSLVASGYNSSYSSSPVVAGRTQLGVLSDDDEEEEEENVGFNKV